MSYRYRTSRARRRGSCLNRLIAFGAMLVIGVGLYTLIVRPRLGEYAGDFVGQRVAGQANRDAQAHIEAQVDQGLPAVIAALPPGEVTVTEEQLNAYIASHPDTLGPIEAATLRFAPGQVQADVRALGVQNSVSTGLAVQDGRIILANARIDGPLGVALSATSLAQSLERQINNQLATQGRSVRDVRIEQGQMVVITE